MINQNKRLQYYKQKAKGLERIRKSAQAAFARAQYEKDIGNIDSALLWMDRAHRLAKDNPNITFDLVMLYFSKKYYNKALSLLLPLMEKFDFFEGWLAQSVLYSVQKQYDIAIDTLYYMLSKYSPTVETWGVITSILRDTGQTNGCALVGSVGQIWIHNEKFKTVSIYLDGEYIGDSQDTVFNLPMGWENNQFLYVENDDTPLIGSPIDIQSICRVEGFVEVVKEDITGWLWYPAEPSRIPQLEIIDQKTNRKKRIMVQDELKVATLEFPLFRPKVFSISIHEFSDGILECLDIYNKQITGSPLNLKLFQKKSAGIKDIHYKHEQFIPLSAYFMGKKPDISEKKQNKVVIIIPIYKGKEETIACIQTVFDTLPKNFIIQLVNDASSDEDLVQEIKKFVDNKTVYLLHHDVNKGFPSAVNTGIRAWPNRDIILLNSDTLVAQGWAESLYIAAYSDPNIGTVTPCSNDASIFSYPFHDKVNPLPSLDDVQELMNFFQITHFHQTIDIPTAHGFCMFIRHDCLHQTGLFRENVFAQGYGEENDFCMRAKHFGWRHVLAMDVFVGHIGGVSFQSNKTALMKRNIKIVNQLYPDYDQMVMEYVHRDFLYSMRRDIDIQRLRASETEQKQQNIPHHSYALLITHSYGGGVERAVQERINDLRLKKIIPIIMRPTMVGDGCHLEILFKSQTVIDHEICGLYPNLLFYLPNEYQLLIAFLQTLSICHIEVHHFLGHHELVRNVPRDIGCDYDMYIHDYMSFCPRVSLINEKKQYCHEPDKNVCQNCVDLMKRDGDEQINIYQWVNRSASEIQGARKVIAPSLDTAKRIERHFKELKTIKVDYLEDDRDQLSVTQLANFSQIYQANRELIYTKRRSDRLRVCIIGAIGVEKGFEMIRKLVKDADKRDLPIEFIIVGRTVNDDIFATSDRVFITGSYEEEEAVTLVMQQQADIAFFPAIWPETWCYALSIAWKAGLQTVSYDIGAIAERIHKTKRGWIMPYNLPAQKQNNNLIGMFDRDKK